MVAKIDLVEKKNDKMYWFNVPKSLEAGFRSGKLEYVLVDTALELQIGKIVGFSEEGITYAEPTRSVVSFLSSSAVKDFYGSRRKEELKNELVNQVANIFSLIAPKNNRFDLSTEDKISMLDYIRAVRGNHRFCDRVDEIDRIVDELSGLDFDWRDLQ